MERSVYQQANACAMKQGVFFGVWWVLGFAAVMGMFSFPLASLAALFVFFSTPFLGGVFTYRFKASADGPCTFGQLYVHSALLYFYASLWMAVAVYVYFAFLDHGAFFQSYTDYLHRPEVEAQLSTPAMQREMARMTGGGGVDELVNALSGIGAATFAVNALTSNVFVGLILSLPAALVVRYANVTHKKS